MQRPPPIRMQSMEVSDAFSLNETFDDEFAKFPWSSFQTQSHRNLQM